MTELHAGGKFDQNSYKVSGGLHGVGVSVVNALSENLILEINRDGKIHNIEFENGIVSKELTVIGNSEKINKKYFTGTKITFLPTTKIFKEINFNFKIIEKRLRELAFLNTGISIFLTDKRQAEDKIINFKYQGGIKEYVKYLNEGKNLINPNPIFFKVKKIILQSNVHYNGLIVIMKILFVSLIILSKEMVEPTLLVSGDAYKVNCKLYK